MKKKTKKVDHFLSGLHEYVTTNPQFRRNTINKSEVHIQTELRPLLIRYLEKYFKDCGYKDYVGKANKSFYWEGQEGRYGRERRTLFGSRNYPDFIITEPYLVAVEYKQSQNGSTVKQGIGQSIMHTLCEDFEFVYLLFHDQNKDKRIESSTKNEIEQAVIGKIWSDFNVVIKFI
ncbi:MAG: hypothetical protein HUJ22_08735 [Gracilimonas sp.]|uniref:hypothetical protein n=1 Tax=Gracilimonas sp. TaxID=1974203 RepID=UPI0019C53854|nr:hypothetical protein [Gracilimonas sp.]MBD3616646.1 hypothetical protein [Gracilimonas sp.]